MTAFATQQTVSKLKVGDKAPNFTAAFSSTSDVTQDSIKGKKIVLYFYPKDDTPGCTIEAKDFRDNMKYFDACNTLVIGVSRDSIDSHDKFREKYCLPFPLASDESGKVCGDYGVWVEKSMYGKKYMGVERATFLIDAAGIVRNIWPKVNVAGHVRDVLNAAQKL